jgi:hypothetical protein
MFTIGLEKIAWPWSPKVSEEHVKEIMPHFEKHEAAGDLYDKGKISAEEWAKRSKSFLKATHAVSEKAGIRQQDVINHMYKHHRKGK